MPRRTRAALVCLVLAAATSGCGIKGPLVLPPKEPKPPAPELAAPTQPDAAPLPEKPENGSAKPGSRGSL